MVGLLHTSQYKATFELHHTFVHLHIDALWMQSYLNLGTMWEYTGGTTTRVPVVIYRPENSFFIHIFTNLMFQLKFIAYTSPFIAQEKPP